MISLRNCMSVGLVGLALVACGSDDDGGVNPSDCAAVGAKQKSITTALGCKDTSSGIVSECQALYASKTCTAQWEKLIDCISPKPNSDFQCDSDNEFEPKSGVCTAEQTAFIGCAQAASP